MKRLILLFLFLFLIPTISAKDYSIPEARVDFALLEDGSINVTHKITYVLNGSFSELFLTKPTELKISNFTGSCNPGTCTYFTQPVGARTEYIVTRQFKDETVSITFNYLLEEEILEQKDTAQFFYQLWGNESSKGVRNLKAYVHTPQPVNSDVIYFIHPVSGNIMNSTSVDTIEITSSNHPTYTYLEINLLMPKQWFSSLRTAPKYMSKSEIIKGEQEYIAGEEFKQTFGLIFTIIIALFLPALFLFLYFRHGTEKSLSELGYHAELERSAPEGLSPAQCTYLADKGETPDILTGELLMLEKLGIIDLEEREVEGKILFIDTKSKKLFIKIDPDADTSNLRAHQNKLLTFLKSLASNNELSTDKLAKDRIKYREFYDSFFSSIKDRMKNDLMDNSANKTMGYGIAIVFLIIIIQACASIFNFIPFIIMIIEVSIFTIIVGAKPQVLGKWTDEGRILERKSINFKKFLNDYTLLKEKKITDVLIWEEYLIYATAFGISEKVLKAAKLSIPEDELRRSSHIYATSGYIPSLSQSVTSASASSGSSGGGFGGGGGGGGGGAGAR
jgi:uncharacterized membrane protein